MVRSPSVVRCRRRHSQCSKIFFSETALPIKAKFYVVPPSVAGNDKVTPGSLNEQTMMGWSPGCYIQSFVEIGPPVPEKKALEGFLPYMGVVAILVM